MRKLKPREFQILYSQEERNEKKDSVFMVQLSFEIPTLEEVLVRTVASLGMTTVLEPPCIVSMVLGDLHLSTLNHGHDFQLLMTRVAWCSSLGSSDYIFCFELGMALKPKAHVELVIHVWLAFSHVTSPQLLLWLHFFFLRLPGTLWAYHGGRAKNYLLPWITGHPLTQLNWFLGSQGQTTIFFCI